MSYTAIDYISKNRKIKAAKMIMAALDDDFVIVFL